MAIIKQKVDVKKEKMKVDISQDILLEMQDYMTWANINDFDYFVEQCVRYVFDRDTAWKKYKKEQEKLEKTA